jgi:beta-hydroxyacyl-ACP dehydratase FabZ
MPTLAGSGLQPRPTTPVLDLAAIMALLPHRYPFLMIDSVLAFEKGARLVALKNVTANEPCFAGHFPERPIMPGVLIIEAMAQAGVILYTLSMDETDEERRQTKFLGSVEARFIKPALPGDQLLIELHVERMLKGAIAVKGVTTVNGKAIVKAEFLLMQATRRTGSGEAPADV